MTDADGAGVPAGSGRARDAVPPGSGRARDAVPPGSGRARNVVGRRRQRRVPETGRVHHLGAAPAVMPVHAADPAGPAEAPATDSTRTAAVQLASRTRWELERLLGDLGAEMARAAADLEFEAAARLRDEVARVQAELDRRPAR